MHKPTTKDDTPVPPEPAEVPKPPTDAALRRRVAEIDGWRFFRDGPYGFIWACHSKFEDGEPRAIPYYESDLNAAEGAVRRWCERNGCWMEMTVGHRAVRVFLHRYCADGRCKLINAVEVPASHPHAAARAMSEALVAADEAVKAGQPK